MFSFVGDTVLDPFTGTASTQVAAAANGRNSIGIEVDPVYHGKAAQRMLGEAANLLRTVDVGVGTLDPNNGRCSSAPIGCVCSEQFFRGLLGVR